MRFPQSPVFGGEGVISQSNKGSGYSGLTEMVICVSTDQVSGGDKMRGRIRRLQSSNICHWPSSWISPHSTPGLSSTVAISWDWVCL